MKLMADAGRVVKKEQVMKDDEFPEDYSLTVFPFTTDVSFEWNHNLFILFKVHFRS